MTRIGSSSLSSEVEQIADSTIGMIGADEAWSELESKEGRDRLGVFGFNVLSSSGAVYCTCRLANRSCCRLDPGIAFELLADGIIGGESSPVIRGDAAAAAGNEKALRSLT